MRGYNCHLLQYIKRNRGWIDYQLFRIPVVRLQAFTKSTRICSQHNSLPTSPSRGQHLNFNTAAHYFKWPGDAGDSESTWPPFVQRWRSWAILCRCCSGFQFFSDKGNSSDMANYGFCLYQVESVDKGLIVAAHYYKPSADHGNSTGMFDYGLWVSNARRVERNFIAGSHYCKLPADKIT
jgi:TPR repeat protein